MLSNVGVVCAAAILGKPKPIIPAKGAPSKASPFSSVTLPKTYPYISMLPTLTVSLTKSPFIFPVP